MFFSFGKTFVVVKFIRSRPITFNILIALEEEMTLLKKTSTGEGEREGAATY